MINEKSKLSDREEQVLKLLLKGYLHKQIGDILGISLSRVHDVKSLIKKKWEVQSDIDFFLAALNKGYLNVELKEMNDLKGYVCNPSSNVSVIYNYL